MRRILIFGGILVLVVVLVWSAISLPAVSSSAPATARHLPTPAETPGPLSSCEACAQATLAAALTQEKINLSALQAQATATADILRAHTLATANAQAATEGVALTQEKVGANALEAQATATADILRAHTLATANAEAATRSAAQAQEKLSADVLQAQAAATADILQAHTQATAKAEAATQSAAQTQEKLSADALAAQAAATADRLRANTVATARAATATQSAMQTEAVLQQSRLQLISGAATQTAIAAAAQQRMDQTVSGTGTAIAVAALQAQSDAAQRQEPSASPLGWFAPILILVAAVLSVWGVSRWLAQRRSGERSAVLTSMGNPPPPDLMASLPSPGAWPEPGSDVTSGHHELTQPDSRQVRGWLEELRRKRLSQRPGSRW